MVEWLFLAVPWGCLPFVIVVFPDHTHFLFLTGCHNTNEFATIIDDNIPLIYVMMAKLIKINENVINKDNFDSKS